MLRMRVPRYLTFIGGAVVFLIGLSIHALDYFHRLTYLKEELPVFYSWLVGPTVLFGLILLGVVVMITGLIEMRKERSESLPRGTNGTTVHQGSEREPHTIQQETGGAHSPATAVGSIGDVGAGAKITIGGLPLTLPPRAGPAPRLIECGIAAMTCQFPFYNERLNQFDIKDFECIVLAIRNAAKSSADEADNVIAHLDFESDVHAPVRVNEVWWSEDEEETGTSSLFIGREQTKHLVIGIKVRSELLAVPKEWRRLYGRHMPGTPLPLHPSHWRITAEVTAEHAKAVFYSDAEVHEDGRSTWSPPVTTRPAAWPGPK